MSSLLVVAIYAKANSDINDIFTEIDNLDNNVLPIIKEKALFRCPYDRCIVDLTKNAQYNKVIDRYRNYIIASKKLSPEIRNLLLDKIKRTSNVPQLCCLTAVTIRVLNDAKLNEQIISLVVDKVKNVPDSKNRWLILYVLEQCISSLRIKNTIEYRASMFNIYENISSLDYIEYNKDDDFQLARILFKILLIVTNRYDYDPLFDFMAGQASNGGNATADEIETKSGNGNREDAVGESEVPGNE